MRGFFEHRITFWQAQLIGWAGYCVVWFFASLPEYQARDATIGVAFVRVLIMTLCGLSITSGLRLIYKRLWSQSLSLPILVGVIVGLSFISGVLWGVVFESLKWPLNEAPFSGKEWFMFGRGLLASSFLLFGWSVLYIGIKYSRLAQEQRERALLAEAMASKAQLQLLQYQLNPHFFFNALNTIRALIDEDPDRAREAITGFSEFIRYAMVDPSQQRLTLGDELASIQAYLDIEKIRFEERLIVSIEADQQAEDTQVPPFIVHPLVENAIKHGELGRDGALQVRINIQKIQERLQITVANTGELEPDKEDENYRASQADIKVNGHTNGEGGHAGGIGLANLRQRLDQLFGERHRFNLYGKEGWVYAEIEIG